MSEEHELLAIFVILGIVVSICANVFQSRQLREFKTMVAESLAHLREQIEHAATVKEKAVELLHYMRDKLDNLQPDATAIRALADELRANTDKLADAMAKGEDDED